MFYLVFAVLTSTAILICFKLFDRLKINTLQAIVVNYVVASAFGFIQESGTYSFALIPFRPWFPIALASGVMLIVGFNLFALSAQKAGITISAIAARMSVVIPVILGFLVFHDTLNLVKIAGILLALGAFYLTFIKDKDEPADRRYFILPLLLFLAQGMNDTILKTAQHFFITGDFVLFLSTAFLICLVLGLATLFYRSRGEPFRIQWQTLAAGIILGLLNWFSTLFMLKGLSLFDVSLFLPLLNVSIVSLSALSGYLFFRERLSRINLMGILAAVIAIVLLGSA